MHLTDEQHSIINSSGNIKINAVAGSGKTTTVIEYAKTRRDNKILYIAFNKSVKTEAEKKFQNIGLSNVRVETAHSLAYASVVANSDYKITNNYKIHEIKNILGLGGYADKHIAFILAKHVNKLLEYYFNSDKRKIEELNYPEIIADPQARLFALNFEKEILRNATVLFTKMWNREINITHSFYLKKFQLTDPILPYDYILFDEGQDASPAMLDIFKKQNATKVIVGDTHQQIYGWRHAINSLDAIDYPTYYLTTSFRFDHHTAALATKILQWKKHFDEQSPIARIVGAGGSQEIKTRAVLARKNSSLLTKAIEMLIENKEIKNLYFEGHIDRYTFADDSASIWDVYNLYIGNNKSIRDEMIKSFANVEVLKEYIEKTDDTELSMMLKIIEKYGRNFPDLIKELKANHVEHHEREKADMIFSTVHRCKGMEYDEVILQDDFIKEKDIKEHLAKLKLNPAEKIAINEEINILYVAATRAKNTLNIPKSLESLLSPSKIKVIESKIAPTPQPEPQRGGRSKPDPYYSWGQREKELDEDWNTVEVRYLNDEQAKSLTNGSYKPWTEKEDKELRKRFNDGIAIAEIAFHSGRTRGAIRSRLKKLGLIKSEKILNQ